MFGRAVLAFLLLPGIVAFGVPVLVVGPDRVDPGRRLSLARVSYALAVMVAFHLRIVFGEEPWLARRHGDAWARYRADVARWLGRRV